MDRQSTSYFEPVAQTRWGRFKEFIERESTFFRLHLVTFTILPLIFSGIIYACNGRFHIDFTDCMFLSYSAMTVTGLFTVNLSTLTAWQQVMLYLLMFCGDITTVSWIMVLVRKEYFKRRCEYIVKKHQDLFSTRAFLLASISSPIAAFRPKDIIDEKRVEEPEPPTSFAFIGPTPAGTLGNENMVVSSSPEQRSHLELDKETTENRILPDVRSFTSSPRDQSSLLSPDGPNLTSPRSMSPRDVEFAIHPTFQSARARPSRGVPLSRRGTFHIHHTARSRNTVLSVVEKEKRSHLGGFPGPISIFRKLLKRAYPKTYQTLERKLTIPYATTVPAKSRPWLETFDLFIGRNSNFDTDSLTDEQVEVIGGTEYKALRLLSYMVPAYFVLSQALAFLVFGPWLSVTHHYDGVFEAQPRLVQKPWFSMFQIMGAYTGGGLSLVDLGMLPFQDAYLMIFALMFVILAGNHALPIFLRWMIWTASKFTREGSDNRKVLSFLLEHPRRCFVYLFPSHQTWFLVFCLIGFSVVEWLSFEILNIGLPIYDALPLGQRIVTGLFQGLAARASGFSIVAIAQLAPALQFLYVVMMYIAVYPVAMSIRSTNVYEERSLGVFEEPPEDDEEPDDMSKLEPRQRIGRYVGWHLRRQLSIDIWWLVWGVFLVAIIERHDLLDESKKWFDLFHVLFELVSAFGGIGLSLGVPYDNFSFAGAMRPLSKIVIIVIMVRGRHRGLPVAVDRAIQLPIELKLQKRLPTRLEDPQISSVP
ncbi:potassium transporter [Mycena floridula]|nr:potassium transporter [Mycena floridula]